MTDEQPGGSIRIGDTEREDAIKRLAEHYEAGRLTAEEHADRVDQALQATTAADLSELFADLPSSEQKSTDQRKEQFQARGPWHASGRPGFVGRVPLPLLVVLGVVGVLASVGCVVGAGHPPVLPVILGVVAFFVVRKRRMERRA
jgi:hypothetical protein